MASLARITARSKEVCRLCLNMASSDVTSVKTAFLASIAFLVNAGCGPATSANNSVSATESRPHYPRIYTFIGKGARPSFENDRSREIQFIEAETKGAISHGKEFWSGVIYDGGEIGFTDGSSETYNRLFAGTGKNGLITWVKGQD